MSRATHSDVFEDGGIERLQAEVCRMAEAVCTASNQAALDGINAALALAADRKPETPALVAEVASQVLARAELMQAEIDRFLQVAQRRRM